jgi:ribokinase
MLSPQILIVGSYAAGLVMQTQRLPAAGETILGHGFRSTHGGKGSNQAVQAARLGVLTAFLGMVGRDAYGDACAELHTAEGIDTRYLLRHPQLATGVGFIVVDAEGHNLIALDMGANSALSEQDLDKSPAAFSGARVVLAPLEIPPSTAMHAMRKGREAGATTILNPAPALNVTAMDLSCVDYLTPNETEARVCLGLPQCSSHNEEDLAAQLLQLGCRNVLMTLGQRGCLLANRNTTCRIEAPQVDVVDTTGAGDSFNAAFAVGLCQGMAPEEAAAFGCRVASLSTTKSDTVPSYPYREDLNGVSLSYV